FFHFPQSGHHRDAGVHRQAFASAGEAQQRGERDSQKQRRAESGRAEEREECAHSGTPCADASGATTSPVIAARMSIKALRKKCTPDSAKPTGTTSSRYQSGILSANEIGSLNSMLVFTQCTPAMAKKKVSTTASSAVRAPSTARPRGGSTLVRRSM